MFHNGSQAALLNSNHNNNVKNDDGYIQVTDDMLLPPHKRGDSLRTGTNPGTEL